MPRPITSSPTCARCRPRRVSMALSPVIRHLATKTIPAISTCCAAFARNCAMAAGSPSTTNRDYLTRNLRETQVFERGDDFIIDRLSYDPETSRMRNDRVNIRSSVRRVSFSLRLYSFPELSELLSRAGLGPSSPSFPKILRQTSRRASGSRRGLRDSTLSLAGARIRMGRRTASALAAWRVLASGSGSQRSGREGPPL